MRPRENAGLSTRRYSELSKRERGTIYIAAWLLHYYGYGYHRIKKILLELFNVDISESTLRDLLYMNRKPRFRLSAFEKAIFYHIAYKLALEFKREHPEWGCRRIATELSRLLPIHIPYPTVRDWVRGRCKPRVTPINLDDIKAIAYCCGVLVGDYRRASGGLANKDKDFIEYYVKMYWRATGVKPNVGTTTGDLYITFERGGWLRALWKTGLWKIYAYLEPAQFLKGAYDSEGGVSPCLNHEERTLRNIVITFSNSNPEVKDFVKLLLEHMNFEVKRGSSNGKYPDLRIYGWDQARRFKELIDFRVSYRRKKLEDLLKLESLSMKQRYQWWVQHYEKVNGRWRKKKP